MCGITGYIGNFDQELLREMTSKLNHRGPDDQGIWQNSDNTIGFGHTRLSIQDLSSAGHQPMWTEDERFIIVYNGEVYNFKELKIELESKGIQFKSKTDTEVILKGIAHAGFDFVKRLNGIFAFALYDQIEKTTLLVRDGMGVKPLYVGKTPKGFLFSSEMKSLLLEKSLSRDLNERGIINYLSFIYSPGKTTLLNSVEKVLPGEAIIFKDGKIVKQWFYYDIPIRAETFQISESEAIKKLDHLLEQAVHRQLISDVPVGAFLSGGLDSSTLCYYASREVKNNFDCFTIDLSPEELKKEGITNDLPYAIKMAKHLDVKLHTIKVGSDAINILDKMIYHLDEPQADPAILNTLFIAELARKNNIKVLLSGAGGDDLFTGYRRHYALMQEKYWSNFPKIFRTAFKNSTNMLPDQIPAMRRVKKAFAYADYSSDERLASYFLWCSPDRVCSLLNKNRFSGITSNQVLDPLLSTLHRLPDGVNDLNKMLYLEQKHFLPDHNLNYTDKMTMAFGVEARVPFLDNDLIDFASSLPIHLKQNGSTGKYILKKTMEKYLPHEIIYRPKTGFGAPLRRWLQIELKDLVNEVLSKESINKRGVFDYNQVNQLVVDDRNGLIDASYTIFGLVCFEMWMKQFLD
jgi:asparagine synthase (glutamine-hydrolysing)